MEDKYEEKDERQVYFEQSGCGPILLVVAFIVLFWLGVGAFFLFR